MLVLLDFVGKSTRDRAIVEQYTGNGRKCPPDLTQTKPCYLKGCYRWNISDWSLCMPQVSEPVKMLFKQVRGF